MKVHNRKTYIRIAECGGGIDVGSRSLSPSVQGRGGGEENCWGKRYKGRKGSKKKSVNPSGSKKKDSQN